MSSNGFVKPASEAEHRKQQVVLNGSPYIKCKFLRKVK
jgi:hypothetical protein